MRKAILIPIVAVLALAGVVVYRGTGDAPRPGNGRGMTRPPMPVNMMPVARTAMTDRVLVVGNLIGAATVQISPKVNGRLESVPVKLGDSVRKGQPVARIESSEIQEQVRQAEASFKVSSATIRQREADLKLAETNLNRSKSLFERQLLPKQTFDDTNAQYQAALAQLDLARAQHEQAKSRLDELKITLANTVLTSPVDGFVGKRFLDPGAFVNSSTPIVSVVDIKPVRLVANLVEKDFRRVKVGTPASVEVDAFPGEQFSGQVSRVAPVFDPATRTAEMEIEVPNPALRLKPGMYARVTLTVGTRPQALAVPANAIVRVDGRPGVFVAEAASTNGQPPNAESPAAFVAKFVRVETGLQDGDRVEVIGIDEGTRVITTGAGALKDGDRIVLAAAPKESSR
ncbi:MAG TPA: efflux RND transporter periplasmic adaptor subunit [Vicinamibacterales bacterium]|nr:efflux RND transporter periplasmic adaptor subunit [Vicinamibacterales bacterium]